MCAMSGGVDSSVAAAMLLEEGHDVTGVTLKLWGGASDSGCCSVSDVEDARRVAQQLGIAHHVFNFGEDFDRDVVDLYVSEHAASRTPNPCIECNRSIKFARLLERARALGFEALATGHHATVVTDSTGHLRVGRGADMQKDQSYVLHMLEQSQLVSTMFPVGSITKAEVRRRAGARGLRTAQKAESQEVCFIAGGSAGRRAFLGDRIGLTPSRVVDTAGNELGRVPARELVTLGQRRGLAVGGAGEPRYVVDIDAAGDTITVGRPEDLLADTTPLGTVTWSADPLVGGTPVLVQTSAHGHPASAVFRENAVSWDDARPRVAPGQSVVFYDSTNQFVLGGAPAA
ncbi:MAG TPA: tRNA 2-thiouridine(34) synthase MnmA [Acidimicrobiales bacterium]|nr:tRNA 2-thiouridine(34) synthase MnmA [Acidimicrobiales bacterium]